MQVTIICSQPWQNETIIKCKLQINVNDNNDMQSVKCQRKHQIFVLKSVLRYITRHTLTLWFFFKYLVGIRSYPMTSFQFSIITTSSYKYNTSSRHKIVSVTEFLQLRQVQNIRGRFYRNQPLRTSKYRDISGLLSEF